MKVFLFVLRSPPYDGCNIRETLDMIMTFAAFDQPVRILLMDDGIYLLKSGQKPEAIGLKPVLPLLEALEVYDVEGLWVEAESLRERGIVQADLALPARIIQRAEIGRFIAAADVVVSG